MVEAYRRRNLFFLLNRLAFSLLSLPIGGTSFLLQIRTQLILESFWKVESLVGSYRLYSYNSIYSMSQEAQARTEESLVNIDSNKSSKFQLFGLLPKCR